MMFSYKMEGVREFLESSTVHGLNYISTTRNKIGRIFWIAIIFFGFSAAGYLITKAFKDWKKYPIESSIQTYPIKEVRFPTVTVCPPKVPFDLLHFEMCQIRIVSYTIKEPKYVFWPTFSFEDKVRRL